MSVEIHNSKESLKIKNKKSLFKCKKVRLSITASESVFQGDVKLGYKVVAMILLPRSYVPWVQIAEH